jgi:hypothetical protein
MALSVAGRLAIRGVVGRVGPGLAGHGEDAAVVAVVLAVCQEDVDGCAACCAERLLALRGASGVSLVLRGCAASRIASRTAGW